jgi:Nif-specific regulatory protein
MEKSQKFLTALYEISKIMASSEDYNKNISDVRKILKTFLDFEEVFINILDPDTQKLVSFGSYIDNPITYKKGEGITGKVWKFGTPIVVPDISKEENFLNKYKLNLQKKGKVAFIAVPVKSENKVIGVLGVEKSYKKTESLDDYTRFLTMVGNILGQNIKLISKMIAEKRKLEKEKEQLKSRITQIVSKTGIEDIIGVSKPILEIVETIKNIAPTPATVLLLGESGVGKELFAKTIHKFSDRADKPFIKINCAAIPEDLLESELFGYEKGAFTGAYTTKKGKFELANGGTIFLDEIGDMPISLQAKILRVLQEKEVERIGSAKPIKVDVRVIAATNKNLEDMVNQGTFREDLYYRLNVIPVYIPPLRERKEDIPVIINYFINKFNKEYGKQVVISEELMQLFLEYEWPGNVRQLQNTIERMVILSKKDVLTPEDLPKDIKIDKKPVKKPETHFANIKTTPSKLELPKTVEEIEKEAIINALEKTNYVVKHAAKLLGMTPRQVRYRMEKYRIPLKKLRV